MKLPSPFLTKEDVADLPAWKRWLLRLRFPLAAFYALALVCLICGAVGSVGGEGRNFSLVSMVTFVGGPVLLLSGCPDYRWPKPVRRRYIATSIAVGALLATLLCWGVFATVVSLLNRPRGGGILSDDWRINLALLIGAPWLAWAVLFWRLFALRWTSGFTRMYRLLLAGTWLELIFTLPVDLYVRRRTHCYCEEGTFFAMVIGIVAAFWTFGPGVAMLLLAVRIRRVMRSGCCIQCGYDLRGLSEPRCPECGTPFSPNTPALHTV